MTVTAAEQIGSVKRYLAVTENDVTSFHRFYMGVTHMNIRPGVTGVGYKAQFRGDAVVLKQVKSYGYNLWVGEGEKHTASKSGAFTSGQAVTLRVQNFDAANYGNASVNAEVFLQLNDGTVLTSSTASFTLKGLLEQIAADVTGFTDAQMAALQTMCSNHEAAMADWAIDAIRNWTATEAA